MRSMYIGLAAAALCWTGAISAGLSGDNGNAADMIVGRRLVSRINNRHRNGTASFAELGIRQQSGQCGPQYGRCPDGQCCSEYGFCGETIDHCHPLFDCQEEYGECGWPRPPPTTTSVPTTTTAATTSSPTTPTTTPTTPTTSSDIPIPTGPLEVTTDGRCGNGTMCIGNPNFGACCSQFFWCGSSMEYCGAGCQSEFGACFGVPGQPGGPITNGTVTTGPTTPPTSSPQLPPTTTTSTTTSAAPTVTIPPGMTSSTDGRCGNNVTCLGSNFGRCCSQFGYCGDGDQYCPYIVGCQPEFGYCEPQP